MAEPALSGRENSARSLLDLAAPVLRARDFRLYTRGGGRLVDLWQYGGAAILGHTPAGVLRALKNTAERGLFVPFPHPLENRFLKALSRLFPDRVFRFYADTLSLRRALACSGFPGAGEEPFFDPALSREPSPSGGPSPGRTLSLWRPFLTGPKEAAPEDSSGLAPLLVPVLPWPAAPRVLALEPALEKSYSFPPSDPVSPVFLAAALRAVYDLIAAGPERGEMRFRIIKKALVQSKWRRRGIYLSLAEAPDGDAYAGLFRRFLEQGFLLPPARDQPLILPGCLSPGEEVKLARLLGDAPRERDLRTG
jgi:hypothetical protein